MRAFVAFGRAIASFYAEMFFLLGISLLWWGTGGIFVGVAGLIGWMLFTTGGPWWLAPLVAIPAGPALAALAVVARRCARDIRVDRSFYFDGLRAYWRQGLALSAIGMVMLSLFCLNFLFYFGQPALLLVAFSALWAYLALLWIGVQLYVYPILTALEQPKVLLALRNAVLVAVANPFYSTLLVILGAALTALSVLLVILLPIVWPAVMALLGEHGVRLVLIRAGVLKEDEKAPPRG